MQLRGKTVMGHGAKCACCTGSRAVAMPVAPVSRRASAHRAPCPTIFAMAEGNGAAVAVATHSEMPVHKSLAQRHGDVLQVSFELKNAGLILVKDNVAYLRASAAVHIQPVASITYDYFCNCYIFISEIPFALVVTFSNSLGHLQLCVVHERMSEPGSNSWDSHKFAEAHVFKESCRIDWVLSAVSDICCARVSCSTSLPPWALMTSLAVWRWLWLALASLVTTQLVSQYRCCENHRGVLVTVSDFLLTSKMSKPHLLL